MMIDDFDLGSCEEEFDFSYSELHQEDEDETEKNSTESVSR